MSKLLGVGASQFTHTDPGRCRDAPLLYGMQGVQGGARKNGQGEGRASIGGSKSCTPDQMRDDRKSPIFVSHGECEVKLQGAVGCPKADEVGAVCDPVCSPLGHIVVDFPAPCGRCSRYQNTGRANVDVLQLQAKERD